VGVQQEALYARPALVLEDGTKLPPLNCESRRLLDKHLSPTYSDVTETGEVIRKTLRLSDAMNGRIFQVASGKGGAGWSPVRSSRSLWTRVGSSDGTRSELRV
jgi:hypothetical protein